MKIPSFLSPGDTIAIVSTARKITRDEIHQAVDFLGKQGFRVKIGDTIGMEYHQFAGTDKQRLKDFQKELDDPKVKAILCARGGYGTTRFVDELDWSAFLSNPKWIIGYSDITALHGTLTNLGVASLHATMPINFHDNDPESWTELVSLLKGQMPTYTIPANDDNHHGSATGKLTGGNLSMLYAISGTKSEVNMAGNILFLEDLDEYLYHIDRMMGQLQRSGKLASLAGLIVGGMTKMNDNEIPFGKTALEIILEYVASYDYPVLLDFPAGHLDRNLPLIMGAPVTIDIHEKESYLKFDIDGSDR